MQNFAPCLFLPYKRLSDTESVERLDKVIQAYRSEMISDIYITTSLRTHDARTDTKYHLGEEAFLYLFRYARIPLTDLHFYPYGLNTAGEVAGFVHLLKTELERDDLGDLSVFVCTSPYHISRALILLERYGLTATALTAKSLQEVSYWRFFCEFMRFTRDICLPYGWKRINDEGRCRLVTNPDHLTLIKEDPVKPAC